MYNCACIINPVPIYGQNRRTYCMLSQWVSNYLCLRPLHAPHYLTNSSGDRNALDMFNISTEGNATKQFGYNITFSILCHPSTFPRHRLPFFISQVAIMLSPLFSSLVQFPLDIVSRLSKLVNGQPKSKVDGTIYGSWDLRQEN